MANHQTNVKEKYGDTLTITKTADENYAQLQTRIIDEYVSNIRRQIEVHNTRKGGAIAGAISFGLVLLLAIIELILCSTPVTTGGC